MEDLIAEFFNNDKVEFDLAKEIRTSYYDLKLRITIQIPRDFDSIYDIRYRAFAKLYNDINCSEINEIDVFEIWAQFLKLSKTSVPKLIYKHIQKSGIGNNFKFLKSEYVYEIIFLNLDINEEFINHYETYENKEFIFLRMIQENKFKHWNSYFAIYKFDPMEGINEFYKDNLTNSIAILRLEDQIYDFCNENDLDIPDDLENIEELIDRCYSITQRPEWLSNFFDFMRADQRIFYFNKLKDIGYNVWHTCDSSSFIEMVEPNEFKKFNVNKFSIKSIPSENFWKRYLNLYPEDTWYCVICSIKFKQRLHFSITSEQLNEYVQQWILIKID